MNPLYLIVPGAAVGGYLLYKKMSEPKPAASGALPPPPTGSAQRLKSLLDQTQAVRIDFERQRAATITVNPSILMARLDAILEIANQSRGPAFYDTDYATAVSTIQGLRAEILMYASRTAIR